MSDQSEKVLKISKIDSSLAQAEKIEHFDKILPNAEYFERLMTQKVERQDKIEVSRLEEARKPSPMEEAQRAQRRVEKTSEGTNLNSLLAQAEKAIEKIDSVKRKLSMPNLELKGSVQNVLRSKLTHIDESLKVALSKVGVDYVPPEKPQGLVGPLQNFINHLTHGQSQLESLAGEVTKFQDNKDQMSGANMLMLQLKMGFITQELELFSSLLNKSLESIKTLMNVQV
ncbi:MAG: hypothetical protein Q8K75_04740 [Chlamydiales bacterium]|nr:hypothetical protein [Chlamydiales bacterium]